MNARMDIYSVMMIPFTVAAFCRGRRHLPEAVALANAIRDKDAAEVAIAMAQKRADAAESRVVMAVKAVEAKMKECGAS